MLRDEAEQHLADTTQSLSTFSMRVNCVARALQTASVRQRWRAKALEDQVRSETGRHSAHWQAKINVYKSA